MTKKRVRYERMIWALRVTIRVTLALAVIGTVAPGSAGELASAMAIGLIIAAPLLRVAWLTYRWWRWGDRRFASVAAVLLVVVGTGSALAIVTR